MGEDGTRGETNVNIGGGGKLATGEREYFMVVWCHFFVSVGAVGVSFFYRWYVLSIDRAATDILRGDIGEHLDGPLNSGLRYV